MTTENKPSFVSRMIQHLKPYNLIINLLALFSTIAISLLSYAGAIAIGCSFPFAIAAFFLSAIVALQVNLDMISGAMEKLRNFFTDRENLLKNILFLIASVLATISLSATTLLSAVELFSFSSALLIAGISSFACFFISYEILHQTYNLYKKFPEMMEKFYENLKKRHPAMKALIILVCIVLALSALYYIIATAATWWTETQLGLLLMVPFGAAFALNIFTAPFSFITQALFLIINPIKAMLEFSNKTIEFNFLDGIKDKPGLVYNPFYWINSFIAYATSSLLFLAHSACHALMASRASLVTIAGTIVDFFADAHFTIARTSKEGDGAVTASKHTHHGHSHGDGEPDHSHGAFDFIVMLTQTAATTFLALPAVLLTIIINIFVESQKPLSQIVSESFRANFYFVVDYFEGHEHGSCADDHPHDAATKESEHAEPGCCNSGCKIPTTPLRDLAITAVQKQIGTVLVVPNDSAIAQPRPL